MRKRSFVVLTGTVLLLALRSAPAAAHCDTMDGPVVKDAQAALVQGAVAVVLRWVRADAERLHGDATAPVTHAEHESAPTGAHRH